MSQKIQPAIFTFQPRSPAKRADPKRPLSLISLNRVFCEKPMMKHLSSRSVTNSSPWMNQLPVGLLARIFTFVDPTSFKTTIPKVSKQWLGAFPLALDTQKEHCKKEVQLLAELMKNLKDTEIVITIDRVRRLFAESPFRSSQYRFEYFLQDQVPIIGRAFPDFFEAVNKEITACTNVAYINQIIWSVAEKHEKAKIALVHAAAAAFEKEMRAPIQSLLPKDPG